MSLLLITVLGIGYIGKTSKNVGRTYLRINQQSGMFPRAPCIN